MTTVRTLLRMVAIRHWPLWKMDVSNAFIHEDLQETVYMKPPPGYSCPLGMVCKLCKSLYGLKPAPHACFKKFRQGNLNARFYQSHDDHLLFICRTSSGMIVLVLYVDDIIISSNDIIGISQVKSYLMQTFKMKDLGKLTYFLGLEIKRTLFGIHVHQKKYAEDLLTTIGFSDGCIVDTPMELNLNLRKDYDSSLSDATSYCRFAGSLIYLTMTRLNIDAI